MQVSASLGLKAPAPAAGGAAARPKATGAAAHQEVDLMGGLDDEPAAAVGTQHPLQSIQISQFSMYILRLTDQNHEQGMFVSKLMVHVGRWCQGIWRRLERFRGCWKRCSHCAASGWQ